MAGRSARRSPAAPGGPPDSSARRMPNATVSKNRNRQSAEGEIMSNKPSRTAALCLLTATSAVAGTAIAAETGGLEEIVITARKRDESAKDVPVSVTAFSESTIAAAGITRPQDFIGLTPN